MISAEKTFEIGKCSEVPDSGPCVAQLKRFYFDIRDGQCHSFVYSGCGGNTNNFKSLEECQRKCSKLSLIQDQKEPDEKSSEDNSTDTGNFCIFNEKKYELGAKLDIGHNCIDCECRIPPDFTCIQKSCPTPPTNQCKVTYSQSECCPKFDCNYNKSEFDFHLNYYLLKLIYKTIQNNNRFILFSAD